MCLSISVKVTSCLCWILSADLGCGIAFDGELSMKGSVILKALSNFKRRQGRFSVYAYVYVYFIYLRLLYLVFEFCMWF